jgi:nucleoside 2-deoxyribosyltransferase
MNRGTSRKEVRQRCLKGIDECDVFLAYINSHDCYGTIAETEHAIREGKLVVMAFAPGIATPTENEYWFVSIEADRVLFDVKEIDLSWELATLLRSLL